jgi:hypothetical protein
VIQISQIYGGPEVTGSKIDRVLTRVDQLVAGGGEGPSGSLDIVFHVHGSLLAPEHSGVRTGRFSKKERMLMLQIAVPKEVVEKDEADIEQFLLASLKEAVDMAALVFRRHKIPYDQEGYLAQIRRAQNALMH